MKTELEQNLLNQLKLVKNSARYLRAASAERKNAVLLQAAKLLGEMKEVILRANAEDLKNLDPAKSTSAFRDRLTLNDKRIDQMIESLKQVATLSDPVGEIDEEKTLENGLRVQRTRSPLGVIFMIFESRPNVAIEAFSLGFKAGNAMILRGGKESRLTSDVLYGILSEAIDSQNIAPEVLWGISDPDREIPAFLLKQRQWIDVVVPRGGDSLIHYVVENSTIPIIKNDRGMCHVYVHEDADLEMAQTIVANAKTQRPGVCNAMETLLVHHEVAPKLLPKLYDTLKKKNVVWFGCPETLKILSGREAVYPASEESWDTEYLDYKINCRVVGSQVEAEEHISSHGSGHSEAIITKSPEAARRFEREIDAAAVYWNASTRFTDGFELGLGGELGISTQKLHVRGPVGLRELTSLRWIIEGNGQIRN
ncbi:MAG: glutamate-5-semialdehyde dehydrogenase [Bdellovibrionia bacterium]